VADTLTSTTCVGSYGAVTAAPEGACCTRRLGPVIWITSSWRRSRRQIFPTERSAPPSDARPGIKSLMSNDFGVPTANRR
jgi:hypothetical protein